MLFFRRKKFASTFKQKDVEYEGVTYTIRELSVLERGGFMEILQGEDASNVLAAAWLINKACAPYTKTPAHEIASFMAPGCINFLSGEILDLSGIGEGAVEEAEKKSESSPS